MEHHEIIFNLHHNENLEKYQRTFWGRVNNFIIFNQIFLSTMVFSGIAGTQWYGALMAALTIGMFVYHPERKVSNAEQQIKAYTYLRIHHTEWEDDFLKHEFTRITKSDSEVLGCFFNPTYNRTVIQMDDLDYFGPMTKFEKIMAWLGGDLPVKPS